MPEIETWKKEGNWKARYSKLYSSRIPILKPKEEEYNRISFMSNEIDPYTSLLKRMRNYKQDCNADSKPESSSTRLLDVTSTQGQLHDSNIESHRLNDLGGHDTALLDMVRRSCEAQRESQDKVLELAHDCDNVSVSQSSDACFHGLNMRMTERSISRSRVSRMSTRRDMDIPSILAFTASVSPQVQLPAFQTAPCDQPKELPKWSIRRSLCPVCSQKWKDRSSVANIKNSGLKRNSSIDLPSVTLPARLKTSITMKCFPRPVLMEDKRNTSLSRGSFRNSSASWQLVRARRYRMPKSKLSAEDTAPPISTAPIARENLNQRVIRFISDMSNIL